MHNTAPGLLAQTDEQCLSCNLPGCCQRALPFSGGEGETTTFYIFRMCKASPSPLAAEVPALGCCAHCGVSPAPEIFVVTAGQGTCQEAQEINGTAAMLMLSLIMQVES